MSEVKTIKLEDLVRLPEVQIRTKISQQTVKEYSEMIGEGVKFDPIAVTVDAEGKYIVADGWHRLAARELRELRNIEVIVIECDPEDAIPEAIEYSCRENSKHGLRMSNADKRNAIKVVLANAKLRRKGDRPIAMMLSVSPSLVKEVRMETDAAASKEERESRSRRKKSSTSSENPVNDDWDEGAERMKTFKRWVEDGHIEWSHVIEAFATPTHFPILIERKNARVRLILGERRTLLVGDIVPMRKTTGEAVLQITANKSPGEQD